MFGTYVRKTSNNVEMLQWMTESQEWLVKAVECV
jgi:hypothetical protein